MRYKINYKEGTWFAVPLRIGGYGIGVVARAKRTCTLGYFFGPRRESVPGLDDISTLKPTSAVLVLRVGDLGLVNGKWPIIGNSLSWNRADWPMPIFMRYEPVSLRKWLVYYSDIDPSKRVKEVQALRDAPDLPQDLLAGYGAAEARLSKLLSWDIMA